MPFEQAVELARSLKLRNSSGYGSWCKTGARPENMPTNPIRTYSASWYVGWHLA